MLELGAKSADYDRCRADYLQLDRGAESRAKPEDWLSERLRKFCAIVDEDTDQELTSAVNRIGENWISRGLPVEYGPARRLSGEEIALDFAIVEKGRRLEQGAN